MKLEKGAVYDVVHSKIGRFGMRFISQDDDWARGYVVGNPDLWPRRDIYEYVPISIRIDFCVFFQIKGGE